MEPTNPMREQYEEHRAQFLKNHRRSQRELYKRFALFAAIAVGSVAVIIAGPSWLTWILLGVLVGFAGASFWRTRPGRCVVCRRWTTIAVPLSARKAADDAQWWRLLPSSNRDGSWVFTCVDDFFAVTTGILHGMIRTAGGSGETPGPRPPA